MKKPQNIGEIKNADGVATVGNPVCGDVMKFYIKIGKDKKEKYIKDIKFQTLGCGAAIASSSILTVIAKGKTLNEAKKINKKALIKALGGLPIIKIHCSVLADEGLRLAIKNYLEKTNISPS
ncbi:MAG: iron-sulfur cluster assembly scaffold protein [Candidatus Daviesbacteria bacterium]|nr:iron-sulfur cluster assembly scaffold protein [Candidatus Daviesbacteria bacterium]